MSGRASRGPRRGGVAVGTGASGRSRLLTAALLALGLIAACQRSGKLVGRPAPDFTLSDLSGHTVRLANLKGRVVFLNVWATWCQPCREEMPSMEALYQRMHGPDFEMVAASADEGGKGVVEEFVRQMQLTFPVLLDPEGQLATRYGVTGFPETFIIDRNGRVVAHELGPRAWSSPESREALQRLIEHGEWRGF